MVYSAKHCRLQEHCTPRTFKQALVCATQHHPTLSAEEIADRAEIPLKWLYDYANESQQRDIPAVKLTRVIDVTGRIDLGRFLFAPIGFTVVPLVEAASSERLLEEVLDVQDASGDLAKTMRLAMSDRVLDERELDDMERHATRVQNEAAEVLAAVRANRPTRVNLHAIGSQR
jgi:hypothetical protein